MIRIFLFLLLLLLGVWGYTFVNTSKGGVILYFPEIYDYTIAVSPTIFIFGLTLLIIIIFFIRFIISSIVNSPRRIITTVQNNKKKKGSSALENSLIALGAGDHKLAQSEAIRADRLLENNTISKVLLAQIASAKGDNSASIQQYKKLAENKNTHLLGLHGLYQDAAKNKEYKVSKSYAEKALLHNPKLKWALEGLLSYYLRENDWEQSIDVLGRLYNYNILSRTKLKRYRAVLNTAFAIKVEQSSPQKAKRAALDACKVAPDLINASIVAANLIMNKEGNIRKAARILERSWKALPHPELAATYTNLRPGDTINNKISRINHLISLRPNHLEGMIALARTALDAKKTDMADIAISNNVKANPTQRICLLMAEIETNRNNIGKVKSWLAKTARAKPDPIWVGDGFESNIWKPTSPISGKIDVCRWITPSSPITLINDNKFLQKIQNYNTNNTLVPFDTSIHLQQQKERN